MPQLVMPQLIWIPLPHYPFLLINPGPLGYAFLNTPWTPITVLSSLNPHLYIPPIQPLPTSPPLFPSALITALIWFHISPLFPIRFYHLSPLLPPCIASTFPRLSHQTLLSLSTPGSTHCLPALPLPCYSPLYIGHLSSILSVLMKGSDQKHNCPICYHRWEPTQLS